jgi:hypothetical protein
MPERFQIIDQIEKYCDKKRYLGMWNLKPIKINRFLSFAINMRRPVIYVVY